MASIHSLQARLAKLEEASAKSGDQIIVRWADGTVISPRSIAPAKPETGTSAGTEVPSVSGDFH